MDRYGNFRIKTWKIVFFTEFSVLNMEYSVKIIKAVKKVINTEN
jgi:hypothetical protein